MDDVPWKAMRAERRRFRYATSAISRDIEGLKADLGTCESRE
jgi:hypothetical protein